MKLNRTKILVISLVVITLILGGAALYIANRLQTQIQTPSSAATSNPPSPTYKCKVIYYRDAAFAEAYKTTDTVPANTILQLYISRTATGAFTNVGVNNVSLRKGTTRMAGIQPTGNNYSVSIPADQIAVGANVFEFGYNIQNNNVATGDWCEPYTIVGRAASVAADPICNEMKIGVEGGAAPAKLNTRTTGILLTSSQKLVVSATFKNVPVEEVRKLLLYNAQNVGTVGNNSINPFVSYNASDSAVQTAKAVASTTAGEVTFSYKLAYADLFKVDSTALQNAATPAETPQWKSGEIPNLVKINIPVKVGTTGVANTYSLDCIGYVKRQAITVSNVNTSTAACVGLTIGKNGGTQTKRNTRSNPLLLTTGDTLNITHTLKTVPTTETTRTLRLYNAQNISADGNNTLNGFTSYYSTDASGAKYVATKVANGSNFDFKYTLLYSDLFKADTATLVRAATPAENPQWVSGGIPNLLKIAVPVKPFSAGIDGTYSNDCLGYISRVGISLVSTSGDTSGGTSGDTSGDDNNDLPSTDLSAFNIFTIIGGSILLFGGITIMKYRSRFENI